MQDSVFLDNRTFQRVWQRVAGSMDAPVTTPPVADTLTDLLAECIRAKAAGAAFYTALSQRIRTRRQQLLGIAAQERAHQKELQVEYFLRGGEHRAVPAAPNAGRHGAAGPLPRPSRAKPARLSAGLRQIRAKNAFLSKWYLTL